jgi:hypothetical protein
MRRGMRFELSARVQVKQVGGFVAVGIVDSEIDCGNGSTACAAPKGYMYAYHGYTYEAGKGARFGITDSRQPPALGSSESDPP